MRKGTCFNTYTGNRLYIIDPQIDDISVIDIAHALSLVCRANGHFKHFYSVAQHSINCYKEAHARGYSQNVQLACLFHDGSEAYISDIARPAKEYLNDYLEIEKEIQNKVYEKFCPYKLTKTDLAKVAEVDDIVLWYEFNKLHNMQMWCEKPRRYAEFDLSFRNMNDVENEFISTAENIYNIKRSA